MDALKHPLPHPRGDSALAKGMRERFGSRDEDRRRSKEHEQSHHQDSSSEEDPSEEEGWTRVRHKNSKEKYH